MATKVTLIGFEELASALDRADELFVPLASGAIAVDLLAIQEELAPYPPQPDRNRSGHFNTYVRGQGNYPKSAFVADSGEPGGYRTKRVPRGSIRLTSQQMDKKFRTKVEVSRHAIVGELRNDAGYSGHVIGPKEGDPHQVDFHAKTGWQNADDAIEAAQPKIQNSINFVVGRFLKALAGK